MTEQRQPKAYYGKIIAASCFSIQAIGVGSHIAYGVFFNPLMDEYGWSRATIAGASSLAFFLMGLLSIFVGRLNDRIGPRKMLTITAVIFGCGYMLMSTVSAVWQLYLFYGIVVGVGLSAIDVIPLSTVARWFSRRRGFMTGIVKVGTGAGQFTIPFGASLLIVSLGWPTTFVIMGACIMILLVVIAQFMRRDPGQVGLPDDWENRGSNTSPIPNSVPGLNASDAYRTRQFWIIFSANLVLVFCLLSIMVHIVPHAQDLGISMTKAAGVMSVIGGVSMLGRFVIGISIDRIGSRKATLFCYCLLVADLLWLQMADNLWMLVVFAAFYGVAHGGFFTAISPLVAEYFGIGSHGVLFGSVVFGGCVGGAIGPVVAGYIFDVAGSYSPAFWLCVGLGMVGFAMIYMLKPVGSTK